MAARATLLLATTLGGASPLFVFGETYPMQVLFFALAGAFATLLCQGLVSGWRNVRSMMH